ncbi:MAG: glutathione S-transferase family protein [Nanoarchaeota archaeon]
MNIYGNKMSNHTRRVLYVAEKLGLEYHFKHMDFQKDLKTEEFLRLHPAGKIPVLEDGEFILFESNAICRYLATGSELYPEDKKKRAMIDQWIDFCSIHVGTPLGKVAFNRAWAPMMKIQVDEHSLNDGLKWLDRFLPIIDGQLGIYPFVAGREMSVADMVLLSVIDYAGPAKVDLSSYKHLVAWHEKMQKEEFYPKLKMEI